MRWLLALCLVVCPTIAAAQDDGTVLSRFIEDQLSSGDDRRVTIEGFRGALSSEATLARMTISDADGAWLVLEDAVLNWSRAALLRGELQVNELTAARLQVIRSPLPSTALPSAEAQPFALPNLPVRVEIGRVAISEVVLGEAIIGLPATLSVEGSVTLANGAGEADIILDRLDGPAGQFSLDASFDNANRNLALSLLLEEAPGGLAATLLNLPGGPDIRLSVEGDGPPEEFAAQIALATEGRDRITGQVIASRGDDGQQLVIADISGDITPLLIPEYREFFGDDVMLQAQVRQTPDGAVSLEGLRLAAAALSLEGNVSLNPNGLPEVVSLVGQITPPTGDSVRLPLGGVNARIASAGLVVGYNRAEGDSYRLGLQLDRLTVDDLAIADTTLDLQGTVALAATGIDATTATLQAALSGLRHTDPALVEALGTALTLTADLSWIRGAPVILSDLSLQAGDLAITGGASARTADGQISIGLGIAARVADLSRFAAVAGQPLSGAMVLSLSGPVEPLSGAFDLELSGTGQNLRFVEALPVEVFAGQTELSLAATRDTAGLTLRDLRLENAELSLTGAASVTSGDTSASTRFDLRDVGLFTDLLSGPVTISADVERAGTAPFDVIAALTGPNQIAADVAGRFDAASGDLQMDVTATATGLDIGNGVPPQLLAGRTDLSASVSRAGDVLNVADLAVSNPELRLNGDVSIGPEESRADVSARLTNVGLFTDALSGPVTTDAAISRTGNGPWQVQADLGGPGGMRANVGGQLVRPDGSVDITATGQAPLALANRFISPRSITGSLNFNLAMRGQPGLAAMSGSFSTGDARVALPSYALAVQGVSLNGQLSGGRVNINANGTISSGGQLAAQGSVNLASAGLDAQLGVTIRDARLVDPTLYEARITTADLNITGPLARGPQVTGTVNLGESEIRVPEADLAGSAAIPEIRHLGETRDQRLTRQFAGLLAQGNGRAQGSNSTGLDVTINAPGRIYLRGRGIDAEFGGSIRIFGTTANIIPTGQFNLIRGRLSILGTRLDFTEGSAVLQGSFDPFLRLVAQSRASGYTISIRVEGSASSPEITFSSSPALPEDEVLAQLLFGRSVSGLSPLQLLQLADAATSLAGGRTNSGLIANLREGLGLDDLDYSTDAQGNAAVTAGRYLSENIYTDVTINGAGDADLSLNIDLTDSITARGSVGSNGGSSIGIFFERDY